MMNNIEYREHLEELRDALDDAATLADEAITSREAAPDQKPEDDIIEAWALIDKARVLVRKTARKFK